jgi:hypothetical protein
MSTENRMGIDKMKVEDLLPVLKIFEDRMTKKEKFKKMMSGLRLYRRLKRVNGCLEQVVQN